jgi:HEAT repeat protein
MLIRYRVFFFIALSWLWLGLPSLTQAQFLSQGERIGSQTTGGRARDRVDRKKKGANITEWVRRLNNDRPETRLEAVKSLGNSKDPLAIEHLVNATADIDIRVKIKAIEYLGNLRATDATPVLAQQLFLRNTHMGVKKKVLIALGKIGDPRGAEPIIEFLRRNLDEHAKGVAIYALRDVGNEQVLVFLDNIAEDDSSQPIKKLAARAATDIRNRLSPEFEPVIPTYIMQVELRNQAEQGGGR